MRPFSSRILDGMTVIPTGTCQVHPLINQTLNIQEI
jgi:hypothetical protein